MINHGPSGSTTVECTKHFVIHGDSKVFSFSAEKLCPSHETPLVQVGCGIEASSEQEEARAVQRSKKMFRFS